MPILVALLGIVLLFIVLWDTFETIVIPKTVERRLSVTSVFYDVTGKLWSSLAKRMKEGPLRLSLLSSWGPLSLLLLIGTWAVSLIAAFGLIHWGFGTLGPNATFGDDFYFSGVTFFTLGFGDLTPTQSLGRFLSVAEAGVGFGFLAVVISYLPVLYASFSTRERLITLLDSKAGSNPSGGELLKRHADADAMSELVDLLKDWEKWCAAQLESYLSYPIMAYYRSQHDEQSWLCSLIAIMDACALIEIGFEGQHPWEKRLKFQAKATFAMGRHVIVDLAYILDLPPDPKPMSRCSPEDWRKLTSDMAHAKMPLKTGAEAKLRELRELYEGYAVSLARNMFFVLPAWVADYGALDNWQQTAWDGDGHFSKSAENGDSE